MKLIRNSKLTLLVISAISLLLVLPFSLTESIDLFMNQQLFKLRYTLKGKEKIYPSFVVINIDDNDVEALGIEPYNRKIFSELIGILSESQVKTVVLDMVFQHEINPDEDKKLVLATKNAGNIFYPVFIRQPSSLPCDDDALIKKIIFEPTLFNTGNPYDCLDFKTPFKELQMVSGGMGAIRLEQDKDGICRKLPLFFSHKNKNQFIPSLVLAAISDYLNFDLEKMEIFYGKRLLFRGEQENMDIPIDKRGRMLINYSGPWENSIENRTLRDIMNLSKTDPGLLKELLSDTMVLVADISSDKQDYTRGIFHVNYPSSGILSNALNTILTDTFLKECGTFHSMIISLLVLIAAGIILIKKNIHSYRIALLSFAAFVVILSSVLFLFFNIVFRISSPLSVTLVTLLASFIYKEKSVRSEENKQPGQNAAKSIPRMDLDSLSLVAAIPINEEACREYEITPAQRKLLKVLQKGHTYRKAAEILGISENTIKKQISRIKDKTNLYQKKDLLQLFFPFTKENR